MLIRYELRSLRKSALDLAEFGLGDSQEDSEASRLVHESQSEEDSQEDSKASGLVQERRGTPNLRKILRRTRRPPDSCMREEGLSI